MRLAIFKAMCWSLARDRGALMMSFILPPLVFVIFASIFSTVTNGELQIALAVVDERGSNASQRLMQALRETPGISFIEPAPRDHKQAIAAVAEGRADAGLVVRNNATAFDNTDPTADAPILLLASPAREIAVTGLSGALQAAYFKAMPEAVIGVVARVIDTRLMPLADSQRDTLTQALEAMARRPAKQTDPRQASKDAKELMRFDSISTRQDVFARSGAPLSVCYYAGAVAVLFLMFSSMTGAMSLIDERESGLIQRLSTGPGGAAVVVEGKFWFIVLQGMVQIALIFAVAWLVFDVQITNRFTIWLATSVLAAVSTSGLALMFVSFCSSRPQAHSLGNFLILVMSALGGSMIPRYLMPVEIRDLGWLTPNTWVLEGYAMALWRPAEAQLNHNQLLLPLGALALSGLAGLLIARTVTSQSARA